MFQFSSTTQALLHQAGWSEDYRYDPTEWEALLKGVGNPVHKVALDFMRRFGGLVITYPRPNRPTATEELKFTVNYGIDNIGKDMVGAFSEEISEIFPGTEGCDIGTFNTGDFWLMMDASGVVYGYVDCLFLVGSSGEEAIENICSGNYGEELVLRFEPIEEAQKRPIGFRWTGGG